MNRLPAIIGIVFSAVFWAALSLLLFACSSAPVLPVESEIPQLTEETRKAVQPISGRGSDGRFTKAVCVHGSPVISSTTQNTHEDGCVTESSTNKQSVASSE